MSKIAISGNASGTGTFTIASPATNTDRTITLPDSTGTMLNDQSNIEAQVKTATNATGSAPIYACRAWVNFNGQGTVAIRASGNVSSITDNGVGDYTVNFATAMPDANYSIVGSTADNPGVSKAVVAIITLSTTSTRVTTGNTGNSSNFDSATACISLFR